MREDREHSGGQGGISRGSRSKRTIFRRTVFLMVACGVALFVPLLLRLWNVAVVDHDYYQQLAAGPADAGPVCIRLPGQHLRPERQHPGHVGHGVHPGAFSPGPGAERG